MRQEKVNTTIVKDSLQEWVKVTDPKHPLYNKELPFHNIIKNEKSGKCSVVVVLFNKKLKQIPIDSTSLGNSYEITSDSPLSFDSVKDLLFTYEQILNVEVKHGKNNARSGLEKPKP